MNTNYEALKPFLERRMALEASLQLFGWDEETLAPEGAGERTALVVGVLSDELRKITVDPDLKALLEQLTDAEDISDAEKAVVRELKRNQRDMECIPAEEYRAYSELQATASSLWAKARESQSFADFAPILEKVISYSRRFAGYKAKEGQALYDVLLEDYEHGFPMAVLDPFFSQLKEVIQPLVRKAVQRAPQIPDDFLYQNYPVEKQKEFNRFLLDYLGFDWQRGVLAESAHPFTTNLHKDDVRITTHYYPHLLTSAIFSTIHECGHALYEFGIRDDISQTPVGGGASSAMHESQSRFYENILGRSPAFWRPIYGKLQEMFPEQLQDISLETYAAAINKAIPSPVRTESDELTYCLHIIIRYELEKQLIDGSLAVKDLPQAWNDLYEEYLGIRPANDAEGVLQDIHWAQGSFGYFPSYALGNAYGAQIYHQLEKELDVDALLSAGKLSVITDWLHEHIHQYGATYEARELLRRATGEDFNPQYYFEYLQKKFG